MILLKQTFPNFNRSDGSFELITLVFGYFTLSQCPPLQCWATSHCPKTLFAQMSEHFAFPKTSWYLPKTFPHCPKTFLYCPKTFRHCPKTFMYCPKTSWCCPKTFSLCPKTSWYCPKTFSLCPKTSWYCP